MESSTIKIVIADDHALFREGVKAIFSQSKIDIEIVGEASTGDGAIEVTRLTRPDLLLLDLSMPGIPGVDVLRVIKKTSPDVRVIVMTMYGDAWHARECMVNGAAGFVSKSSVGEELFDAIRTVASGSIYLKSELMSNLWSMPDKGDASWLPDSLTDREKDVTRLLLEGYSNKTIASFLSISENTVRTHRSNVMKKMDAHNALELANKLRMQSPQA